MFQSKFATGPFIGAIGCAIAGAATAHDFTASSTPLDAKPGEIATVMLVSSHRFGSPQPAEALKHVAASPTFRIDG